MDIRKLWQAQVRDRIAFCLLLLATVAYFVLVIGFAGFGFWRNGYLLEHDGVPTVAAITRTAGKSDITFQWKVGQVTYEASDGEGHRIHSEGDTIAIRYLPYRPSVAHFDWERLQWRGKMIILIGLPIGVLFLWLLPLNLKRKVPQ